MTEEIDTILIRVPKPLKKELQILALQQDTNMTDIIIPLIKNYVEKHRKV